MDSSKEKQCPFCAETILKDAKKCKHCHELLDPSLAKEEYKSKNKREISLGAAAILSLIFPGAGQLYKGQVLSGLLWFIVVILGYFPFIFPGIILHLFCIWGAASSRKTMGISQKEILIQKSMPEGEKTIIEAIQEYRREHPVHAIVTVIAALALLALLFS